MLTIDEVQKAVPSSMRTAISQEIVDEINNLSTDPIVAKGIRDNFITYSNILMEGKFKLEDYVNAIMYVSYKVMGYNNQDAYKRAFPLRWQKFVANGTSDKDISSYVAMYHKNKLVNLIFERTLIPTWLLNRDNEQLMINRLVDLALNAKSEKVQCDAASAALGHLKQPESKKVEISLSGQNNGLNELTDQLRKLTEMQQKSIGNGMTTRDIAQQSIIDVTPDE